MGWLLAGIILFVLMVLAEKALIAVTPHELEMLRAEGTPSARRVIYMADESNRRSLAAIAIGKLFTILVLTIQFVKIIHNSIWFQKTVFFLEDQNIPPVLAKVFFVGISLLILTFLLPSTLYFLLLMKALVRTSSSESRKEPSCDTPRKIQGYSLRCRTIFIL